MIADYDKLNTVPAREEDINIYRHLFKRKKKFLPFYYAYKLFGAKKPKFNKNEDDTPWPGRWYHTGKERCCEMLETKGYRIIDSDVETLHRDPIIHFTKD